MSFDTCIFMEKIELKDKVKKLESKEELLYLINKLAKEEFGESFKEITKAQLNFYANSLNTPTNKRYKSFQIPKKNHKEKRTISAPVSTLKLIQYFIKNMLEAIYEPLDAVMGFVKGRSVVNNAYAHINKLYLLNIDISNFFPSITQERIIKLLESYPYMLNPKVAFTIACLCAIKKENGDLVLPQGAPTSPILGNMACANLDIRLTNLSNKYNVFYTRYADDMTFSCMYNPFKKGHCFRSFIESIISEEGFTLNQSKTRIQKRGQRQEVTGLIVSSKVNVSRKYVNELRTIIHNWELDGYDKADATFRKHYMSQKKRRTQGNPLMENVVSGKLEYLKMVKGADDAVYLKLLHRFERLQSEIYGTENKIWKWNDFEKIVGNSLKVSYNPIFKIRYATFMLNGKNCVLFIKSKTNLDNKEEVNIVKKHNRHGDYYEAYSTSLKDELFTLLGI